MMIVSLITYQTDRMGEGFRRIVRRASLGYITSPIETEPPGVCPFLRAPLESETIFIESS
jgi:hypothetical protein